MYMCLPLLSSITSVLIFPVHGCLSSSSWTFCSVKPIQISFSAPKYTQKSERKTTSALRAPSRNRLYFDLYKGEVTFNLELLDEMLMEDKKRPLRENINVSEKKKKGKSDASRVRKLEVRNNLLTKNISKLLKYLPIRISTYEHIGVRLVLKKKCTCC